MHGALLWVNDIYITRLIAWMHHEAYVDSLYGFVDAIEHGLYSSCIGSVEQKVKRRKWKGQSLVSLL